MLVQGQGPIRELKNGREKKQKQKETNKNKRKKEIWRKRDNLFTLLLFIETLNSNYGMSG